MPDFPHRIRTQRWLIQARTQAEGMALRQGLRERWERTLLPAFAASFDEVGAGDDVIHIGRLELRVRLTAPDQFDILPLVIRRQLLELLHPMQNPATPTRSVTWQRQPASWARRDMLASFLETGALPWMLHGYDAQSVLAELRQAATQDAGAGLSGRRTGVDVLRRLLTLLHEADWAALAEAIGAHSKAPIAGLGEAIAAMAGGAESVKMSRYARIELAAAMLAAVDAPGDQRVAVRLREVADEHAAATPPVVTRFLRPWIAAPGAHERPSEGGRQSRAPSPAAPRNAAITPSDSDLPGCGVQHAGLVLFHPFLPTLFEATGLTRRGSRGPLTSPERAAALLYFLATGEENAQEFELGLIKVLVGLAPDSPVLVAAGLLRESDRAEADALLRAVINHWTALQRTSVSALRTTFLRRPALLRDEENGWRLQVEPQSFDVLLDYLPWGVSVARLPWMARPMFTDWRAP